MKELYWLLKSILSNTFHRQDGWCRYEDVKILIFQASGRRQPFRRCWRFSKLTSKQSIPFPRKFLILKLTSSWQYVGSCLWFLFNVKIRFLISCRHLPSLPIMSILTDADFNLFLNALSCPSFLLQTLIPDYSKPPSCVELATLCICTNLICRHPLFNQANVHNIFRWITQRY